MLDSLTNQLVTLPQMAGQKRSKVENFADCAFK